MSILKNPIQVLFLVCGILSLVGACPFTYFCYKHIKKAHENKPDDYEFPSWKDFKWTLLSVAIISVFDVLAYIILRRLLKPYIKI